MKTVFLFNPKDKTLTMAISADKICFALGKGLTACEIAWSSEEVKCFIRAAGKIYKKENLMFSPGRKVAFFRIKDADAIKRREGNFARLGYAFGNSDGRINDKDELVKDALWYVGRITETCCCGGRCSDCPCHCNAQGEGDANCVSANIIRWQKEENNKIKVMGV